METALAARSLLLSLAPSLLDRSPLHRQTRVRNKSASPDSAAAQPEFSGNTSRECSPPEHAASEVARTFSGADCIWRPQNLDGARSKAAGQSSGR